MTRYRKIPPEFTQEQWQSWVDLDLDRCRRWISKDPKARHYSWPPLPPVWNTRCFQCGAELGPCDQLNRQPISLRREYLHQRNTETYPIATFCSPCFGEREPLVVANRDWNATRIVINRVKKEISGAQSSN